MNALKIIEKELRGLGYRSEALIRDYRFANVLSSGENTSVALAAFTQMPESYRSAAFGVITDADAESTISSRRSLGAPILLAIGGSDVGVWRVSPDGMPRLLERVPLPNLPDLFKRNSENWSPQSIHRAKSAGRGPGSYQLDFVDLGLLPAIEHEVEAKLDVLLHEVVSVLLTDIDADLEDTAFRTTFRLLAAKILIDREHPTASEWQDLPVRKVLTEIERYYNLGHLALYSADSMPVKSLTSAWSILRNAISFRNISSDSLAFVYENTLVTSDTRKRFGTHSTPRQVAEYVVSRINFANFDTKSLVVYEPFTGAGSFLVAALRQMRDLLPANYSGAQRHAFLVPRIKGTEIDAFACEVATLSLILADYPNANGWHIESGDLFAGNSLKEEAEAATVVLCNPPWEDFAPHEREKYKTFAERSYSKPMAVLQTVLDAKPSAIGFVLPQGFLRQKQYNELRQRVAAMYNRIELTALPDKVFQQAGFETSVLVCADLRSSASLSPHELTAADVSDADRLNFLATGKLTSERRRVKNATNGDLWVGALDEVWEYLHQNATLGQVADVYRGLQWKNQSEGFSNKPAKAFKAGLFRPADSLTQFSVSDTVFLDIRPENAMYPGPLARSWEKPKILANVARLSRGPWRFAAAVDEAGLIASQAFFGIWPRDSSISLPLLEAILNGPLANAFLTEHAANQHFTNELLRRVPLPLMSEVYSATKAADRFRRALSSSPNHAHLDEAALNDLLIEVDAEILKLYDLPPRLERRLLEFFRGHEKERRLSFEFKGWLPVDFRAYVPLHEYRGSLLDKNKGSWLLETFKGVSQEEANALNQYLN